MICHATPSITAQTEPAKNTPMEKLLAEIPIKRITDQIRLHWGTAEGSRKTQCRVRRDATLLQNYFIDAAWWHAGRACQRVLAQIHWQKKFLKQNFTWVDVGQCL